MYKLKLRASKAFSWPSLFLWCLRRDLTKDLEMPLVSHPVDSISPILIHIGRLRFCSPRKRSMARSSLSLSPSLLRLCLLSGAHRHRCLRHRCLRHRVSQLLMLLTDLHGSSLEKGDSKYSLPFAGSLKSPSHCGKYIIYAHICLQYNRKYICKIAVRSF